jgi:ribosomal protein S7|tara:strand:+ start:28240 stop:28698 length:459 start_codon:yes stop_codon:yes gene_type:complete
MSLLIKQGKKTQCSNIIDLTFDILNLKVSLFTKKEFDKINNFYIEPKIYLKENSLENLLFEECIMQLNPIFKFKKIKIGSRTEIIPIYLNKEEQIILALKSLIARSKKRNNKSLAKNLALEILEICFSLKNKIKSRNEILRLAYINRRMSKF